jgi:hypothetical protein
MCLSALVRIQARDAMARLIISSAQPDGASSRVIAPTPDQTT